MPTSNRMHNCAKMGEVTVCWKISPYPPDFVSLQKQEGYDG